MQWLLRLKGSRSWPRWEKCSLAALYCYSQHALKTVTILWGCMTQLIDVTFYLELRWREFVWISCTRYGAEKCGSEAAVQKGKIGSGVSSRLSFDWLSNRMTVSKCTVGNVIMFLRPPEHTDLFVAFIWRISYLTKNHLIHFFGRSKR